MQSTTSHKNAESSTPPDNVVLHKLSASMLYLSKDKGSNSNSVSIPVEKILEDLAQAGRFFAETEEKAQSKFQCEVSIVVQQETGEVQHKIKFQRGAFNRFEYVFPTAEPEPKARRSTPLRLQGRLPAPPVTSLLEKSKDVPG